MTIPNSFYSSISALEAHSKRLGVVSSNISNLNTSGYRRFEVELQTVLGDPMNQFASHEVGVQSRVRLRTDQNGALLDSSSQLSLGLQGRGFLPMISDVSSSISNDTILLTREGELQTADINGASYLQNSSGSFLMGWPVSDTGAVSGSDNISSLQPIQFDSINTVSDPEATTQMSVTDILPVSTQIGEEYTTQRSIFDAQGNKHLVSMNWQKTTANPLEWTLTLSSSDATPQTFATQVVQFDTQGQIITPNTLTFQPSWNNSVPSGNIALNISTSRVQGDSYNNLPITIDGRGSGNVKDIYFDAKGFFSVKFSNGDVRQLYQVPIADLLNPDELAGQEGNVFRLSDLTSDITLKSVDEKEGTTLTPSKIETSNVDLEAEMTRLIQIQQAYSSASQSIKVIDEMMTTLVDMV